MTRQPRRLRVLMTANRSKDNLNADTYSGPITVLSGLPRMIRRHELRFSLTNFRCFGPDTTSVDLTSGLTAFGGVNGAGKTLMQGLQRLFGVTGRSRVAFPVPQDRTVPFDG